MSHAWAQKLATFCQKCKIPTLCAARGKIELKFVVNNGKYVPSNFHAIIFLNDKTGVISSSLPPMSPNSLHIPPWVKFEGEGEMGHMCHMGVTSTFYAYG